MKQDNVSSDRTHGPINLPPLLNRKQLATNVLGVCERSSHIVTAEDWFPDPIQLGGGRILRWHLQEVLAALADRAPRRTARSEPQQLVAARSATKAGVPA